MKRLFDFAAELKRRKVFQVSSLYLVTAWGASLGAAELLPAFGASDGAVRTFVIGLLLFFPVVVALAWYFELTSSGIKRDPRDRSPDEADARRAATTIMHRTDHASRLEVSWEEQGRREVRHFLQPFTMGRDASCEVSTLDPLASRQHARIEKRPDGWWVVDLDSSNGLFLNGDRVAEAPLEPDSDLQLGTGGQRYRLVVLDRAAETILSPPPAAS